MILLIRILILNLIFISKISAQFLPSTVGVHYKKNTASNSDESFVLDFNNGNTCTSNCSNAFYGEIDWSTNTMTTYTISMWVKSGESNPVKFRAFFNTHTSSSDGLQLDSSGSSKYRLHSKAGTVSFGDNTIKTTWVHLAVVAETVGSSSKTRLYYNGSLVTGSPVNWVESTWSEIEIGRNRATNKPGNYYLDEVRVWKAALTADNINAWMHKPIDNSHPNYSDLNVYFQMNSNSISGTTLLDISGKNNHAQLYNHSDINTTTSYVPVVDLHSSYQTDVEAIWSATGDYHNESDASDGLSMSLVSPASALAEANLVIYGNNGTQSSSSPSILGLSKISDRVWQFDETGTVSANVKIDIGTATGYSGGATLTADNYKLLYKTCTMCDYSILAQGSSISNSDNITFSSVAIKDGLYSIGSTDDNL